MTQTKTTAPAPGQVETVIRSWMAAGLPEGRISWPEVRGQYVRVHVPDATAVTIWAAALGTDIEVSRTACKTHPAFPAALQGWDIQVWCAAPVVPDSLRIATGGAS